MSRLQRHIEQKKATAPDKQTLGSKVSESLPMTGKEPIDILTYVESSWGVNETPFAIQRFILKIIYGIPLDDTFSTEIDDRTRSVKYPDGFPINCCTVWDKFREGCEEAYTEAEFLDFLFKEGRINVTLQEHEERCKQKLDYSTVVLRLGRRGTKTTLSQWIASYEAYKLLRMHDPQKYYRVKKDQPIRMTLVATGKEQATHLLAPARASISRSPFLNRFVDKDSSEKMSLYTSRLIDQGAKNSDAGIILNAAPCSARSLRGPACILALLEEYGFFYSELAKAGSNKSDREIYRALAPSLSDISHPETGKSAGKLMIISTPLTRESHMWEMEDKITQGELVDSLVLHLPSFWINPLIAQDRLRNDYAADPLGFVQEYEARYLDQMDAAFSRESVEACRSDERASRVQPGETVHMGIDLGLKNDGTGVTLAAVNMHGECRVIHHEVMRAGLGEFAHLQELDIAVVASRIDELYRQYGCRSGVADQWELYGLKSYLTGFAKTSIETLYFNQVLNDRLARHSISMIVQKRVKFYFPYDVWGDRAHLFNELIALRRKVSGGNPPKIKLEAPNALGYHDDQYDSLSRALWAAYLYQEKAPIPAMANNASRAGRRSRAQAASERAKVMRQQNKRGQETGRATTRKGRLRPGSR